MVDMLKDNEYDERLEEQQRLFNKECDYYDIEDLEHVSISGKHEYSVIHINIQGIPSKFDNLKMMLHRIEMYGENIFYPIV